MTLENPDAIWFGTNESQPHEGNVLVLNYHHDGESHWCSPESSRQSKYDLPLHAESNCDLAENTSSSSKEHL